MASEPKVFKTLDEQLDILKNRGLKIDDDEATKQFLLHNNYYRISGYSLTLRDHDSFYPQTTFQNIIDIYSFDRKLRILLLDALDKIETSFKSIYAYEFTKLYGPLGYMASDNFTNPEFHEHFMSNLKTQKEKRLKHEAFLKHYITDLHQELPFWVATEIITLSDISKLYSISEKTLQEAIAAHFNITVRSAANILSKYMHGMTIVRNLCAHGARLYNRLFVTKPSLSKKERKLLYQDPDGKREYSKLAGYIINMKRILSSQDFSELKNGIISLCTQYPFVDMKHYGLCDDWKNLL